MSDAYCAGQYKSTLPHYLVCCFQFRLTTKKLQTLMMLLTCLLVVVAAASIQLVSGFSSSFAIRSKQQYYGSSSMDSVSSVQKRLLVDRLFTRADSSMHLSMSASSAPPTAMDDKQTDFCMGYLNKHHSDLLVTFVEAFTDLGREKAKRNAFSGGSYKFLEAKLVGIDADNLHLEVTVADRSQPKPVQEHIVVSLDANVIDAKKRSYDTNVPNVPRNEKHPLDDFVRRMNRLCIITKQPAVTGKLIQLGIQLGGNGVGELKKDMYLNQVPHNRYVRQYFYEMAAKATLDAVIQCSEGKISNRMKLVTMFPEMNPSMDSYRIGTLLELVRSMAIALAEQNLRVRVCVQGSMGVGIFTGTPKQLNGASTIMQRMDWQSGKGENNEGMVGNYVNFGAIGRDHVVNAHMDSEGKQVEQDDVFILLCPQSMIGVESSIMGRLSEMVEAAGDRPVILVNPDLADKVSSNGQQSIKGRKERMEFADSFKSIYHFQNIYVSGTSYFPILGAITKLHPAEPWVAHQRRDLANNEGELYVPVLSTEDMPDGEMIMDTFDIL